MRNYPLSLLLGLTATIALYAPLPAQAQPILYQNTGGKESFRFDPDGRAVLESIGLSVDLESIESTAEPAPGFSFAFSLLPPSSDPSVRGTTLTFLYDDETDFYLPLGGTEEFFGNAFFDVDTTKLALEPQLEIGDFSIRFDSDFNFFVTDTANTGLRLFDVNSSGNPSIDLTTQTWRLEGIDLLISQEFSDFLVAAGASRPVVGLKILEGQADRSFVEASSTQVPEPGSALAVLTAASAALAVGKRRRCT
ncbi:PEP-CTERM sorting domain-containing protein [Moorena producens JHB]|uniref:PEP-CTERM sorting domain-containing protein n=1 Tax=Moorena producens (strain JHB) TaxID=1454205 RepID=A0A1D9FZD7_MOOP1|nr:PEP-CTERM sorting domain-containing protein [Moorena producens]AOY80739.1 PEP-CTERM sorting domain-containing protein [Moorena producens JHB]